MPENGSIHQGSNIRKKSFKTSLLSLDLLDVSTSDVPEIDIFTLHAFFSDDLETVKQISEQNSENVSENLVSWDEILILFLWMSQKFHCRFRWYF